MSVTIPESYVNQFSATVHLLAEQKTSRLRKTVRIEPVVGESFAVETVGGIDKANTVLELHGDTPLNNTPHARRWGFMVDYDVADLIDKQSRVKLLISPDSIYVRRHSGTMGRSVDDEVLRALENSAATGKTGTTLVSIPTGYDLDTTIASFAGFLPYEDPVVSVLVKIDQPGGDRNLGGEVAAPVFASLAADIMEYLNVPQQRVTSP